MTHPDIDAIVVSRRHREIREAAGAEVHRSRVPWRLSVARLLYRAADTVAGDHSCEEINACR